MAYEIYVKFIGKKVRIVAMSGEKFLGKLIQTTHSNIAVMSGGKLMIFERRNILSVTEKK